MNNVFQLSGPDLERMVVGSRPQCDHDTRLLLRAVHNDLSRIRDFGPPTGGTYEGAIGAAASCLNEIIQRVERFSA